MIVPLLAAAAVVLAIGRRGSAPRQPTGRETVEGPTSGDRGGFSAVERLGRRRPWLVAVLILAMVATGPMIAVASTLAAAGWPRVRRVIELRAERRAIDAALPDTIELLIQVVHAGMTPHQAIEILGDRAPSAIRPALHEVRRRVSRGAPLADALGALPDLLGPPAALLADTLAMSERYGTPIADALGQLALDVRERRRRQSEADARTLPIRMSFPLVACTLPSFVLVAIVPAVLAAMASLGDSGF
jgi:tight adherence protein C